MYKVYAQEHFLSYRLYANKTEDLVNTVIKLDFAHVSK